MVAVKGFVQFAQDFFSLGALSTNHDTVGPLAVSHCCAFFQKLGIGNHIKFEVRTALFQSLRHHGAHFVSRTYGNS